MKGSSVACDVARVDHDYNTLDFSNWQDASEFTRILRKLADRLDLFYKEK